MLRLRQQRPSCISRFLSAHLFTSGAPILASSAQFKSTTNKKNSSLTDQSNVKIKKTALDVGPSSAEAGGSGTILSKKRTHARRIDKERSLYDRDAIDYLGAEQEEEIQDPRSHLPDTLLVQLCDHMQHDQGVKRHAVTVTFGGDGFAVSSLVRDVRRDLKGLLATTYWQMNQTHERTAFFICTRVSHGTADMLVTSMTQRVLQHVEDKFGYELKSSNVTLSPDVQHTSVRMLYQYFVFRKKNLGDCDPSKLLMLLEQQGGGADVEEEQEGKSGTLQQQDGGSGDGGEGDEDEMVDKFDEEHRRGQPEFRNFEAPRVGPQEPAPPAKKVPPKQSIQKIWDK